MYKLDQPALLFESSRPGAGRRFCRARMFRSGRCASLIPDAHLSAAAASLAGAERARRGSALYESVDAQHVDRLQLLSARLVHDEVQPQAERAAGRAAGAWLRSILIRTRARSRVCWRSLFELQEILAEVAGLHAVSLQPAAGAQGELTALFVAAAYFRDQGKRRTQVLIPDSAHGTNPASAHLAGFEAVTIKSDSAGLVDLADFKAKLSDQTAVFMITNPNTVGLFDPQIGEIARLLHDRGALLYLDGANMNAILGIVRPGDMGVDLMHYNAHKTFSGPHGGGGPGAGPIAVRAAPGALPACPLVGRRDDGTYRLDFDRPKSIGRVRSFFGNTGILFRAYCYIMSHGPDGLKGIAEHAVLNANYLMSLVNDVYPGSVRRTVHARVCGVGAIARQGPRHPGHGYRQAADRFQLPRSDGLFPARSFPRR